MGRLLATASVLSTLLLLIGCDASTEGDQDEANAGATARYDCSSNCGNYGCLTQAEALDCQETCVNETEERIAAFNRCHFLSENCLDESNCMEDEFGIVNVHTLCREECVTLSDGEAPDLAAAERDRCDDQCKDMPAGRIENFLECLDEEAPNRSAAEEAAARECYAQNL